MAQYEAPAPGAPPASRARWPLAGAMALDVTLVLLLAVVLASVVAAAFLGVRAAQQGISMAQIRTLSQPQQLKLIGVDGLLAALVVQNGICALIPILRIRLLRREPLAEIGFQAQRPWRLVLLGLGLGVVILIGNAVIGALFYRLGIHQNQAAQYPLFRGDYLGQALFMLGAAVLAPIGEEILFRGYVFNALRQTFGARRWGLPLAYGVSALLFALAHSLSATEGLVALLAATFAMGLLLAWGMHRTGSLLPCIIAHATNNSVALLLLLVCVNNPGFSGCPAL